MGVTKTRKKTKITTSINGVEVELKKKAKVIFPLSDEENSVYLNFYSGNLRDGTAYNQFESKFNKEKSEAKKNPLLNAFRKLSTASESGLASTNFSENPENVFFFTRKRQINEFIREIAVKYSISEQHMSLVRVDKDGHETDEFWVHSIWER
jgi:hypothetical protein